MAGTRNVKRLTDLEIDEVSLVDRSANQHADVAIAKRDEDTMTLIDAEGYAVELDELEPGEPVWNAETGEFAGIACEEGAEPADYGFAFDEDGSPVLMEEEPELVGKGFVGDVKSAAKEYRAAGSFSERAGRAMRNAPGRARRVGGRIARENPGKLTAGAAVAGGAGGYAMSKSLGSSVYEELSKALNDDAKSQVVSKALEDAYAQVEEARALAFEAVEVAKSLREELDTARLTEHTSQYGLGDAGQLAEIIKSLDPRQARYLDGVLSQAGDALFSEIGSSLGAQNSDTLGHLEALASQAVTKANVSHEQAMVELLAANPGAYDDYLAEI